MEAAKLRHRVRIEELKQTQDQTTGHISESWETVATVWANVAPVSAREFVTNQEKQGLATVRITIRYRAGLLPNMRLIHLKNSEEIIYNPHGFLEDNKSGLEYITIPASRGLSSGQ